MVDPDTIKHMVDPTTINHLVDPATINHMVDPDTIDQVVDGIKINQLGGERNLAPGPGVDKLQENKMYRLSSDMIACRKK